MPTSRAALLVLLSLPAAGCSRESRAEGIPASAPAASVSAAVSAAPVVVAAAAPSAIADAGNDAAAAIDGGAEDGGAAPVACPAEMARIGRFCIDRWEAHLVGHGPAGEILPLPHYARPPEDGVYEARSEAGAMPQGYISRVESQAACKSAGKRLCSMAEWQRGCEGKRGTNYPYGAEWRPKKCNSEKGHLLSIRFGADARRWRYEDFNDPSLNQEPGFLVPAGSYGECVSDAGIYDMVGSLHEWVSDTVDDELIDKITNEDVERNHQPSRPGNGVFMGGFFSTHQELGPGCKYVTIAHEPTYHDYSTGFRCCADAQGLPAKKGKRR